MKKIFSRLTKRQILVVCSVLILAISLSLLAYNLHFWTPKEAQAITNLLSNPGFESNFTGWSGSGGSIAISNTARSGSNSARFNGSSVPYLYRNISGQTNKSYKVTAWLRINSMSCSGECWGGFNVSVANWTNASGNVDSGYITTTDRPVGVWFQVGFNFNSNNSSSGELRIGPFAGNGWTWDVLVDDVQFFEVPANNTPPAGGINSSTSNII